MNLRKHTPKIAVALVATAIGLSAHGQNTGVGSITPTVDQSTVLQAVDEFESSLTADQKATVQLDFTAANAAKWSNLPVTAAARNGLELTNLTDDQKALALRVAQVALSADGYERLQEIRTADDYLNENFSSGTTGGTTTGGGTTGGPPSTGGSTSGGPPATGGSTSGGPSTTSGGTTGGGGTLSYGSGLYYIAFLGTPSATTPWMLQIGGHHIAFNIAYNGAKVSTTPFFVGVEPQSFTTDSATQSGLSGTYTPLGTKKNAVYALLNSLTTDQLATAKLSSSFDDVLLGPSKDKKSDFPTQQGIAYSALTTAQQTLVKNMIAAWTTDGTAGTAFYNLYVRGLSGTKVAWSGSDTTLNTQGDYLRIDGPRCWIEFVCQNGVVFTSQIHFHTVWRDKTSDYGSNVSF